MSTPSPRRRPGYTMIELLLVIGVLAIVFTLVAPRITTLRDSTTLRAGRQQLAAAFSATRAAALQKGKTATLTMVGSSASVSVRSGLAGTLVRVFGPVELDDSFGITLTPLGNAPRSISYNGRGMMMNNMGGEEVFRYRLSYGDKADTLCISAAGLILPRRCTL